MLATDVGVTARQGLADTQFHIVARDPLTWAKRWKDEHRVKVIGCQPMFVPDEIIIAAGLVPLALLGHDGSTEKTDSYIHKNICHPLRGNFELALNGRIDFLDGLIFPDVCDQSKRLVGVWDLQHQCGFSFFLRLPRRTDTPEALSFYKDELKKLAASLGELAGCEVSDRRLKGAIRTCNRSRRLIAGLLATRRANPSMVTIDTMNAIMTAATVMPRDDFNDAVELFLANLPAANDPQSQGPRVVVCGGPCEDVEPGLLKAIEECGATVVDDYTYPWSVLGRDVIPEEGDVLDALVDAYVGSPPCPIKHDRSWSWSDHVLEAARRAQAGGVIALLPRYCEPYGFEYPYLASCLAGAGMPHLMLQVDHRGVDERLRTRIQAFVEMLELASNGD